MENLDGVLEGDRVTSPYYFYNVMPCALVFELADIWSREPGYSVMGPQWYGQVHTWQFFVLALCHAEPCSAFCSPCRESQAISGVSNIQGGGAQEEGLCR